MAFSRGSADVVGSRAAAGSWPCAVRADLLKSASLQIVVGPPSWRRRPLADVPCWRWCSQTYVPASPARLTASCGPCPPNRQLLQESELAGGRVQLEGEARVAAPRWRASRLSPQ